MTAKATLACLALAGLLGLAAPAVAELVARAEKGSVPLVAAAPVGLEAPVVVQPGGVAWRETYRPLENVRLLDEVPARVRPGTRGVAAGTVLYGYRLKGGFAFCPPTDYRASVREVQCFRDFDNDGRFDGAYVSDMRDMKSRVIAAFLHELAPTNKQRYEAVDIAQAAPVPASVIFRGVKKGQALFGLRIEDDDLDNPMLCDLGADACSVAGLRLRVTPEGEGVRIELLSAAAQRRLDVILTGGPV